MGYLSQRAGRQGSIRVERPQESDEHSAYRQSIIPLTNSSLFCKLKLIKLVSISTRYGGTSAVLCCRNIEEANWGLGHPNVRSIRDESQGGRLQENVHPPDSLLLRFLIPSLLFQLILFPETKASGKLTGSGA